MERCFSGNKELKNKLEKLRELMKQNKFDGCIIPHSDRHDVKF